MPLCPRQGFPGPRLEGEETGPLCPGHSILTGLPVSTFNLLVPIPVSLGCITKWHTHTGLNNRLLSLTVLEAGSPRLRCGQGCFSRGLSPWPVGGYLLPGSSVVFPLGVCVPVSSYRDTSHFGLGPLSLHHFNLINSVKTLSPNTVMFCSTEGNSIYGFWGDASQLITALNLLKALCIEQRHLLQQIRSEFSNKHR